MILISLSEFYNKGICDPTQCESGCCAYNGQCSENKNACEIYKGYDINSKLKCNEL